MYQEAQDKTLNPFVGCLHHCIYCVPSFQRQMKRQKNRCIRCYNYVPHAHLERLKRPPPKTGPNEFIFMCDMGDLAFAKPNWVREIIAYMYKYQDRTFLIQSKAPGFFRAYSWPINVILGTTIETNKTIFDTPSKYRFYEEISKAPPPKLRYLAMLNLIHPRKLVTIEPILDFDLFVLVDWVRLIDPEVVYVGYDNHNCKLPEPRLQKTLGLIEELEKFTEVRRKTIHKAWYERS